MTEFGIRVDANGFTPRTDLKEWGFRWVSIVARKTFINRQKDYLARWKDDGGKVAVVLDSDSLIGDWWNEADTDDQYRFRWYDEALGPFIDMWIVGNEMDHVSPSSWTLSLETIIQYLKDARKALGNEAYICLGGLADGRPEYLDGAAETISNLCNAYSLHLYGQRPERKWPNPDWGFGYAADLIQRYRERLPDLAIVAGEWGSRADEIGDELQAEYAYRTAEMHVREGVAVSLYFCAGDYMVPTFGARYTDWTKREPLYSTLCRISENLQEEDMTVPPKGKYSHAPGSHNVGPGVLSAANSDKAKILSCELYYPVDRGPGEAAEYSETRGLLPDGRYVNYQYFFDTNTVARFFGE